MSTPVELIVANVIHQLVSGIGELPDNLKELMGRQSDVVLEDTARQILCQIAHESNIRIVFAALAAANAPSNKDDIKARLVAAKDAQEQEESRVP